MTHALALRMPIGAPLHCPTSRGARAVLLSCVVLLLGACAAPRTSVADHPTIGGFTTYEPEFEALIGSEARVERLAEGFTWAEGPTWIAQQEALLFSDVPGNVVYRWSERDGLSEFLKPSGFAGADASHLREAGANGLFAEPQGTVLLADSGNRAVYRLDPRTRTKTLLAERFEGRRFNSPNDVVRRADGRIYFTDPPYGLKDIDRSPLKELPFNGVFRLDPDGSVHLVDATLSYPNGVALSPDGDTLYVSNTDSALPVWIAYALDADGAVRERRTFADASDLVGASAPGLPDGMAVAADGHLFATGPGGVLVFDPQGRRLGRIETGAAIANCAFGDDGYTLYLSSHQMLARTRVATIGAGFAR